MSWDFSTDSEYQEKLDWAEDFVRREIFPLEALELPQQQLVEAITPLQQEVKRQGLWAAHLPPEMGGGGFGQVRLGLLHEIIGMSSLAPVVFGNNAPDSGNAELLAIGIEENPESAWQREKWLEPLLDGRIRSAFSMTEPGAGADPTLLTTTAELIGDEWVINGHKWFTSNGSAADILLVMAVTDPDAAPRNRMSILVVPRDTPGVEIVRDIGTMQHPHPEFGRIGNHSEVVYRDVRVPRENLIGLRGNGFLLAQKRLGPGRIHHCMRWLGQSRRAFDMLCERSVSRYTHGSLLSEKQTVQNWIADSMAEMGAARLLTLHAAWKIDTQGVQAALTDIAIIKFYGAQVLYNVIDRAIQVHGSLGVTTDLPLEAMYKEARNARIYDGPDEVHRQTVARRVLRNYRSREVPSEHLPTRRAEAVKRFARLLETGADVLTPSVQEK
ncbi:acyl-CoA dehydrogenase family protein [Mycolicibacterium thermoresistibile]|uniref:Acyl-CoA dehydrogenase domain-containing protein n=2 Tax=Mycolicibacterium thermoresistibile TaxID=1797 RepID=G7CKG8_MYCT3|nr:acyl-CoA dehydrogenase family protein [Mycolicibacterium thermoresistibile]EHI11678.1 acyl-CoA dehydrogenase domain-containing protein [Mycolicibacterium thermoresistibile ATCC 19527]MCV7187895.1 acyl-CoA dehydrogenase family protein [Mycolicibacterium thermoresistibile]GAT16034.1 acyl-CoA dehydrogenase domain-containing protein [Mycolicibacterium thermoresistibile]SNW17001.1 acyl-CoA dehydrogenase domain-containing protein [Mycolicibacterium thermoresistibile]